jgi:hypothetical protein
MFAFSTDNHRKRPWRHTSTTRENDDHEINATTASGSAVAASAVSAAGLENKKDQSNRAPSSSWPVVCLTGFSPQEKDHYHNLIKDLGGR